MELVLEGYRLVLGSMGELVWAAVNVRRRSRRGKVQRDGAWVVLEARMRRGHSQSGGSLVGLLEVVSHLAERRRLERVSLDTVGSLVGLARGAWLSLADGLLEALGHRWGLAEGRLGRGRGLRGRLSGHWLLLGLWGSHWLSASQKLVELRQVRVRGGIVDSRERYSSEVGQADERRLGLWLGRDSLVSEGGGHGRVGRG